MYKSLPKAPPPPLLLDRQTNVVTETENLRPIFLLSTVNMTTSSVRTTVRNVTEAGLLLSGLETEKQIHEHCHWGIFKGQTFNLD